MNNHEIVKKLIGPIEPYGDSSIDNARSENIQAYGELALEMVIELSSIARESDRPEHSIKQIAKRAESYMKEISHYIPEEVEGS